MHKGFDLTTYSRRYVTEYEWKSYYSIMAWKNRT
jgi:hypothetical protein